MRNEGVSKMGYYPTPTSMVEKIMNKLVYTGPCRLFDPCAGEGAALAQLAGAAPDESWTYGIELDGHRAEEASQVLNEVVHCGYESARVDDSTMQLMLLNPPYDNQAGSGGDAMRKELIFLRHLSKKLIADGILIFIIPQYTLSNEMVGTLVQRFSDLSVYRFDDEEYGIYKQVVVFGRRRTSNVFAVSKLTEEEKQIRNTLLAYGKELDLEMPYLDDDWKTWTVPTADSMESITFRGALLDERELIQDIMHSDTIAVAENILVSATAPTTLSKPLLPFKVTHMATLIAAGALNGSIGVGETRHMVVGMSRKKIDVQEVIDDRGNKSIIETESYITAVRTFEQSGVIRDLQ